MEPRLKCNERHNLTPYRKTIGHLPRHNEMRKDTANQKQCHGVILLSPSLAGVDTMDNEKNGRASFNELSELVCLQNGRKNRGHYV